MSILNSGALSGGARLFSKENLDQVVVAVKASQGRIYSIQAVNTQGAVTFIQIFDAATGSVTLGTTTPDMQMTLAATSGYINVPLPPQGVQFDTAISIAASTAASGGSGSDDGVEVYIQYA